jgi:hypothetical protein
VVFLDEVSTAPGRIAVLDIESPSMLANMVCSGPPVVQSDTATEP